MKPSLASIVEFVDELASVQSIELVVISVKHN